MKTVLDYIRSPQVRISGLKRGWQLKKLRDAQKKETQIKEGEKNDARKPNK